jgi:hypothetical protein
LASRRGRGVSRRGPKEAGRKRRKLFTRAVHVDSKRVNNHNIDARTRVRSSFARDTRRLDMRVVRWQHLREKAAWTATFRPTPTCRAQMGRTRVAAARKPTAMHINASACRAQRAAPAMRTASSAWIASEASRVLGVPSSESKACYALTSGSASATFEYSPRISCRPRRHCGGWAARPRGDGAEVARHADS